MRRLRVLAAALLLAAPAGCAGLRLPAFGEPVPAWEEPPPPIREAPVVQPGALHRATLANGLEVLVLEDHTLPRVSMGVTVRRGAGAVPTEQAGLAAFTAELMERGAGDMDALALARAVDRLGASLGVSAGWDSMNVSVSGLSRDRDRLLEVLSDVVLRPRLETAEGRKARAEQLAGLEQAKDDPATLVGWRAMRVLYPAHRYGLPVEGTPETVARLDASAARSLHERFFVPAAAILFAVGDVDAGAFEERARELFGEAAWPHGEVAAPGPPPPARTPSQRRVVVIDRPDLVQARIIVAHEGMGRTDERRIAADLMNDILGGSGFSSRLMKRIRSQEGLTYGVGSGFALRRHPGPFRVSTFTRVPEAGRSVELVLAQLEAIRGSDPPSPDELAKAKTYNVGRFGLSLESSRAVLGSLVDLDLYGLPEDSLDTYRSRVRAVDVEETAAVARALLHPDRAAIVVLGPAEELTPQLERFGPVEVVAP
jgi:zinc protease